MYENLLLTSLISKNSSLLFTIEQWELTRRLKNSGLSKEQLCQAYDDLDRIEAELGQLYNAPATTTTTSHALVSSNNTNTVNKSQHVMTNKKSNKNNNSISSESSCVISQHSFPTATTLGTAAASSAAGTPFLGSSSNAATLVNTYFTSIIDPDLETKQLDEFRSKGEIIIQKEIEFFVHKHDLKQSQIARMAGVNQAYVSKFLRGEFSDLSENGKTLIYKWYLRFLKSPKIFLQAHNITLSASAGSALFQDKLLTKQASPMSSSNPSSSSTTTTFSSSIVMPTLNYEMPKRTRFSFKPEHLTILEREFILNQYPDQKKREELARLCNDARPCSERERVSEQVITHWFQNKRKITKKSSLDESFSSGTSNAATAAGGGNGTGGSFLNSINNNNIKYEPGGSSFSALNSSNYIYMNGGENPLKNMAEDDEDDDENDDEEEDDDDDEDDEENDEDLY